VCGFLNGSLGDALKMPPFIVTLGTLSIIGALNTFYSQSETIREQDIEERAPFLQIMGVPFEITGARIILAQLPARCAGGGGLVFAQPHRLWPPCLRKPATIPKRRGWPASTPTAFCSASTPWPAPSPRSPAGR